MIIFNMVHFVRGKQMTVYGQFSSKKAAYEALDIPSSTFRDFASVGAMGTVGEKLVERHGPGFLIATPLNLTVTNWKNGGREIVEKFKYKVRVAGKWINVEYDPDQPEWMFSTPLPELKGQDIYDLFEKMKAFLIEIRDNSTHWDIPALEALIAELDVFV